MSRQLRGVRVPDNVIRGKLKSHLLPRLSPARSPGPGRSHGWIFAMRRQHQAERRTWFSFISIQLIIIRLYRKFQGELYSMLLWFGLLCYAVVPRTQHGGLRLLWHAGTRHRHRLARARRNNSRLAIGNYEMNAAIVGRSSRSKNQTVQW